MFFLAVRGEKDEVHAWGRVARAHATALGLAADFFRRPVTRETEILLAILDHPERRNCRMLAAVGKAFEGGDGADVVDVSVDDGRRGTVTSVLIEPRAGSVRVRVPLASPDQAYIVRKPEATLITNDLRLTVAREAFNLDPRGIYAFFQYGAVPAPYTVFDGVERVPPAHEAGLGSGDVTAVPSAVPDTAECEDAEAFIVRRIDDVLLRGRQPDAVFFSGGVDSGLLAARIAAAGIRDIPLLNYSFGHDDEETTHAQRMAAHLGLTFERIEDSPEQAVDVLTGAAREYSYPFGDYSTLPMNLLIRGTARWLSPGSEVLDGTGADGAFAVGCAVEKPIASRYARVARWPRWIGAVAGRAHAWAGLAVSNGRVASTLRFVRRGTTMPPLLAAVVAQNSLQGECYYAEAEVRRQVDDALLRMVESLTPSTAIADRASMLDVAHVCGGIFAAKDFDPLRHRGVSVFYPFLHPHVLQAGLALPWAARCRDGERKALLKTALARFVPPSLVYRRKSGFRPPVHRFFARREVRDYIESEILGRDSILGEFVDRRRVELLFRAAVARELDAKAYNFLWALVFLGSWLQGVFRLNRVMRDPPAGVLRVERNDKSGAGAPSPTGR